MQPLISGIAQAAQGADPDTVTPGTIGFVITLLLGVAVFLLYRSLKKQLGRVQVPHAREGAGEPSEELEPVGDPGDEQQA